MLGRYDTRTEPTDAESQTAGYWICIAIGGFTNGDRAADWLVESSFITWDTVFIDWQTKCKP